MGVTFKEDVADIRNSKVVDLVKELMDYSIHVDVIDPHGCPNELALEYGINLIDEPWCLYDIIVLAVGHKEYIQMKPEDFRKLSKDEIYMFDIKGIKNPKEFKNYWRL